MLVKSGFNLLTKKNKKPGKAKGDNMIYSLSRGMKPLSPEGKNDLEIGRILMLNGYDNPRFVIIKNLGVDPRDVCYGARYACVNIEDFTESIKQAYSLEFLRDKKDNRIQMYITDDKVSLDEVLEIWEKAQAAKLVKQAAEQKEKDAREDGLKMLPGMYPDLKPVKDSGRSSPAIGAQNVKKELCKAFPGVKFRVSSSIYSGGSSIDISWTDGPTTDMVKAISDKYQECDFDGMTDSTSYRDQIFTDVFGGAKYVLEQRSCSEAAYNRTAEELGFKGAKMNLKTGGFDELSYEQGEMIKRETRKRVF